MAYDLELVKRRLAYLPPGLLDHCLRTSQLAVELAHHFGVDVLKAKLAGLVHDMARSQPPEQLICQARDFGLPVNAVEAKIPLLLHGPVGAELLQREWDLADEEVLEAVRWHTTGQAGMSPVAKITFLADKLEPGKARLYPHIGKVRELAWQDLDRALLEFYQQQIASLLRRKALIHPAMIEARNQLMLNLGEAISPG